MADDVQLPPTGAGTADVVVATDDAAGAHVQLIKLAYSGDGLRTAVSAGAAGLLVDLGSNNDVTVTSGAVVATLSATDNAVLDSMNAKLATIDTVLDTMKVDTEAIETAVEGTLTVGGTVTANLGVTDNAVLDAIELNQLPDGHNVTVDGSALPTGAATSAKQLADGHNVTVDNASLAVTHSALTELGTAIAGNEMQVDLVGIAGVATAAKQLADGHTVALGATDNAVLDAIATAVELIDNSIKVEDAAHASTHSGQFILGVRNDSAANIYCANNDYSPIGVGDAGDLMVSGRIPHDGPDSGSPVKTGFKTGDFTTNAAAVGNADRANAVGLREGIPLVLGGHFDLERICNNYTTAQTNTVLKTVNSGFRFAVTALAVFVDIDTTLQSTSAQIEGTTTVLAKHPGITPGSGWTEGDGSGILFVTADAADLEFTCSVPTGGSVQVSVSGFLTAD